jgi:hypothetical protein
MNHNIACLAVLLLPALVVAGTPEASESVLVRTSSASSVIAAYTLVAPVKEVPSGLIARAVLPMGLSCPGMKVRISQPGGTVNRMLPMVERPIPDNTSMAFLATRVCEAPLPKGALSASVGGQVLPAKLPGTIKKMAVFGDTGCRMKKSNDQDCNTPQTWPLAHIAESMAEKKPNVTLFLGDFFYREFVCDPYQTLTCGASPPPLDINHDYDSTTNPFPKYPFSDTAYSWLADVFVPMRPIFSAAPLVVVRGNHESCQRGGVGYFRFFDPHLGNVQLCSPVPKLDAQGQQIIKTVETIVDGKPVIYSYPQWKTAPDTVTDTWSTAFKVGAGRYLRLAVVDSAYGWDYEVAPIWKALNVQYRAAHDLTAPTQLIKGKVPENWLLSHQPQFGVDCAPEDFSPLCKWVSETQTAAAYGLLGNYNLLLSSHIHLAQAVQIPGQPGQMILGNGGSSLQPEGIEDYPPFLTYGPLQAPTGELVVGVPAGMTAYPVPEKPMWTAVRFGYAMAVPGKKNTQWTWTHFDPDGKEFARCEQVETSLACENLVTQ